MTGPPRDSSEKKKIGELLVENGYVTAPQVQEALSLQKTRRERICSILIDLGYLNEKDFLEFLGTIPGSASIELSACEIEQAIIDLVSAELARRLELVPIGKLGNSLTMAMVCPIDEAGREELENASGLRVRPVLCSRGAVFTALDRYYDEAGEPVAAIRYHHSPDLQPQPQDTSGVVFLANVFCEMDAAELRQVVEFDDRTRQVLENLRLSEDAFRKGLESYAGAPADPELQLF